MTLHLYMFNQSNAIMGLCVAVVPPTINIKRIRSKKNYHIYHNYDYFADNNEHFTPIYVAIRLAEKKNWGDKGKKGIFL